jgi:alpha-mannosidase
MRTLLSIFLSVLILPAFSQSFIPGYVSSLSGEVLSYHAPQPDATVSLLVRSEDEGRYIEWESAPVPVIKSYSPTVLPSSFLLLAGIDVNPTDPHSWKVFVNDRHFFTISSPVDTLEKNLVWTGPEGSSLEFRAKEVDKYGDFMGYLYCNLPASMLTPGEAVRFKVTGESAGSRTWFMVFQYETANKVSLAAEQAVMRGEKGNSQVLRAEIVRYADPVEVKINIAGKKLKKTLNFGHTMLYLPVPEIKEETGISIVISEGKNILADQVFTVQPVAPRTIYLLHHSHNDIGYTHVQPEVEKMQWENLETAIKMADQTKEFPEGARMKYCTEVMWAVESWYDSVGADQKQAFREAVRNGSIELNGLFANELVSLCGPEELDRLLEAGRRIARECEVELTTAMITDIPGWSWALVPALAHSGVKYLSLGTNRGHRIGDIIDAWGDKPFYWSSPSGREKVLCWIHGEGYSLFHTGLAYNTINKRLQEDLVFKYMDNLSKSGNAYEEVMLRYNIGSDNGPVDETLPQAVKEWNEKYITPKIIISTVDEAFSIFENKHGKDIPEVSGDITCYWEDGAYSTARETIINRNNASRLTQAQALWAMHNPAGYPESKMQEAWRNVLLFDEHTWGSWNSISEPDAPFTLQQWEIKKSFALQADKQSKKLFYDAMTSKILGGPAADAIEVINSCGWERSGLITVSGGGPDAQLSITDVNGNEIPTQLLSDGNIAFIAKNVPPFSSKIYKISTSTTSKPQNPTTSKPQNLKTSKPQNLKTSKPSTQTTKFLLTLSATGSISSLINNTTGEELVNSSSLFGLNEYIYIDGRRPDKPLQARLTDFAILEEGPLVTVVRYELEAPGCKSMSVTIRIIDDLDIIEITNTLDREKVLSPEAVHIAFPFDIPGGQLRYDLAYGYCRPELDQAPGSNKNFLAMEHWIDISGESSGVTVYCPDAPLFEVGDITMDEIVYGWVDELEESGTFYSYLMNNYWETNYAASQEGLCTARYIIKPHQGFNPAMAEKEAIGIRQPLVTRKGGGWQKEKESIIRLRNENLVITALKPVNKGKDVLISISNAGNEIEKPEFENDFKSIFITDPDGLRSFPFPGEDGIAPGGNIYIKASF